MEKIAHALHALAPQIRSARKALAKHVASKVVDLLQGQSVWFETHELAVLDAYPCAKARISKGFPVRSGTAWLVRLPEA